MRKIGVVALVGAVLVLGAANVFIAGKLDKESPEISFPEGEVVYKEGSGYESLLEGVTAVDKKDGDVSESLIIESVRPDKEKESASVVYVAMDHKKNVTKEVREVVYQSEILETSATVESETSTEVPAEPEQNPEVSKAPTEPEKSEDIKDEPEKSQDHPEDIEKTDTEKIDPKETESEKDGEEELEEGSPRITLSDKEITIKKGEEVSRLAYVDDITDDKDDSKELWRKIQIKGDELDTDKEGVYELKYYVIDSDGKKSNEAILKITVQ